MLRVALTGGIATGKTNVLNQFARRDVPTIDADQIARQVVEPDGPAWNALRNRLGPLMFAADGTLNRKRLAEQVFDDARLRAALESVIHPHVRKAIEAWFQELITAKPTCFAIADIPLLFETNWASKFDRIIVTACDPSTQLARLLARDHLSERDGRKRLAAQLATATKTAGSHFVIQTDGSFDNTDQQVERIYRTLQREARWLVQA